MNLIKVGYWKSDQEPHLPDPTTLPQIDPSIKSLVLKYLHIGDTYNRWLGYSWCRFNCGISDAEMGSTCITDKTYLWPQGLYHYVDKHDVSLPQDFINHIIKNNKAIMNHQLKSAIGSKEIHYGMIKVFTFGKKTIYHYGYETTFEPLNEQELKVRHILIDMRNFVGDDDTFDACFKSVLKYINKANQ